MTFEIYAVLKSRAIRQKTVLGVNFYRRAVCRETLSCADGEYFFSSQEFLYLPSEEYFFFKKILDRLSANLVHIGGGGGAASEQVQEPIKGAVN